jgi:DNA-binding PadR family transcriptional regulator
MNYNETGIFEAGEIIQEKSKVPGRLIDISKLNEGLLLKSILPYYVMGLLARGEVYGKQVLEAVSIMTRGGWRPSPGLIYPLLQKIVRLGYATQRLDDSQGHPRRIYKLTSAGEEALLQMQQEIAERLQKTVEILTIHLDKIKKSS